VHSNKLTLTSWSLRSQKTHNRQVLLPRGRFRAENR
jgi:hypothetical protein